MLMLQQAIFLRGVNDPADPGRITTTLYRPKHQDLRYEAGFVRSGDILVPLDNVVELRSLPVSIPIAIPAPSGPAPTPAPAHGEVTPNAAQEEPVVRRRGRPRKNPVE